MLSKVDSDEKVFELTLSIVIIFYSMVIIMSSFSPGNVYMSEEMRRLMSINMDYSIGLETLKIIINNLLVYLSMFLSAKLVSSLKKSEDLSKSKSNFLATTIIVFYIVFFALQGFRVGIGLNSSIYNNYWFSFYTLVFPHGLFEMAGFALASSASFYYFFEELSKEYFIKLTKVGALIIIMSGVLETTLTPWIFKSLLTVT